VCLVLVGVVAEVTWQRVVVTVRVRAPGRARVESGGGVLSLVFINLQNAQQAGRCAHAFCRGGGGAQVGNCK
jgi:hypothetical protein